MELYRLSRWNYRYNLPIEKRQIEIAGKVLVCLIEF